MILVTFKLPSVKVPVLSVNKQLILPLVSMPISLRTNTLSFSILFILDDKTKVTIRGKPSGTVTTITVMLKVREYKMLLMLKFLVVNK